MQPKQAAMNDRLVDILSSSIRRYISFISDSHRIAYGYKSTKGIMHYGFVPMNTESILETLFRLYHYMESCRGLHKFLDIGCGIGNIVLLAQKVGFDAYGLEYNKKIYDIAKGLMGRNHIFRGNMTDFGKYNEYDVLYYYVPMVNGKAMEEFVKKLIKTVKPGAYVIPCGSSWTFDGFKLKGIEELEKFEVIKLRPKHLNCLPIYRKRKEKKK